MSKSELEQLHDYLDDHKFRYQINKEPYIHNEAAAYVTAINILAVEYLIKTDNEDEYVRMIDILHTLTREDLDMLFIALDLNKHISSLGAMITQGDYDEQREIVLNTLYEKERRNNE